jgi:hypothetical protein
MDKVWLCRVSEEARLAASPDFDHGFAVSVGVDRMRETLSQCESKWKHATEVN